MRGNTTEQRLGIIAAQHPPGRGALLQQSQPGADRGGDIAWNGPLVAEEEVQHAVEVVAQWSQQRAPRRAVIEFGTGAVQVQVADRRRTAGQWIGIRDVGGHQLHAARRKVELREERRRHPQRVHRRTDVVHDARILGIGRCPRASAGRRLGIHDPHRQPGPGADHGSCQAVGTAPDDGDVCTQSLSRTAPAHHGPITAHYAVRVSLPVVLIADKLAESTVAALGDQVEVRWVDGPDREKLLAAVPDADALLVRSATTVDAEVLAAGTKLKIVARAGVGLDNVDVDAATARGVLVVNAPTSNIHSAAEHALALLLAAARQIAPADASLREHKWKRSSFSGTEIFGKTVGVVGLGRIGQLVAARVAAFGTHIVAYDPYVSAARAAQLGIELLSLDDLLARADFISVHLPKTPETAGLIGKEALAKTKPGVIIVNAARGGLIDEAALAEAVISGHVRGAGIDVFGTEPCTDSPLFELPQVIVTPHLGASTAEAQDRAGTDVAASVKLALAGEFVPDAVNVGGAVGEEVAPWLEIVRKVGVLIGALKSELPVSLTVQVRGELASEQVEVLKLSALRGLFSAVIEDQVTFVNAPALAAERGVNADISTATESPNHRSVVDVRAVYADGSSTNVAGTLSGPQQVQKIVQINGRNFDLRAEGYNLIINYADQPGALGKIGTLLGGAGIDIFAAQMSQDASGEGATVMLRVDREVPADVSAGLAAAVGAVTMELVDLS
jgi:D-3-phosphoglycerate dehydrogenase / 2-oxoglutarate reductase